MDDEVEIYENCFCYVRRIAEYSEPIVFTHKVGDELIIKTTQPLIRTGMVVKTPKDALVGNKIKLSKNDDAPYGLILFTSNKFKRFLGIEGETYYVTYVEYIDVRTKIEMIKTTEPTSYTQNVSTILK
jgi:hypothetical protein